MKIKSWMIAIASLCMGSLIPLKTFAQCLNAPNGQEPLTTQTIASCNGAYQNLSTNCFNGEYSKVNVVAGNIYSFASSKASDYITISNEDGTVPFVYGIGTVNWTATITAVVRFYTHKNASCAADTKKKTRKASCQIPPCAVPGTITTSAITNTTATISWVAASPAPANGYYYEIRTSGAGGSGSTGLTSSGTTGAGITLANITGLTPGTVYIPYVRSTCNNNTSSFVAGASFLTTGTAPNPVPAFSHIVVVIGENTSSSSVFGSSNAPYINALAAAGAKFTNSFALFHPSQPNYLGLYSGSNQGVTNDNYINTKYTTANLGRELINAGKTYTTYSEGLPSVGYDGNTSGLYARKHNPAANWMGSGTNQIPVTTNQPFTAFPADYNNLPSVSFVVPDLCNDGHDICPPINNSVKQYDSWVQTHLDAYKQWAVNNNSLLIVTYDEDDYSGTNNIATVFYGANVAQGVYSQTINHYNVLRTIEEAFRLTAHAGAAASASPIGYCWTTPPANSSRSVIAEIKINDAPKENIRVYPSPANSSITVLINTTETDNILNWEIINIAGTKLLQGMIANRANETSLDIATGKLNNGIYFIRVWDGIRVMVNRFIISR